MAAPHGSWTSTAFVAELARDGFVVPSVMEGAMNSTAFEARVERMPIPELAERAIVIVDDPSSHEGARVGTCSRGPARRRRTRRRTRRT